MDIREKMHSGDLYLSMDNDIFSEQLTYLEKLYDYNATRPLEQEKRAEMLKNMFAEIGEDCYIEPPLHANWAGKNVHFGKGVYANFNLTLVDDTHIYVGDYTMLGPNVVLATAGHPILPELRPLAYQYNMPIHIGKNCWLGAGVVVVPGITIGDNRQDIIDSTISFMESDIELMITTGGLGPTHDDFTKELISKKEEKSDSEGSGRACPVREIS